MGQGASADADEGATGELPQPGRAARSGGIRPADAKAHRLFDLLVALEAQLAEPITAVLVGYAYRELSEWTARHQWDPDLQEVLERLRPETAYPPWRRQALEEAYRLFFDDLAREGNPETLAQMPEPPTSEEIGFRRLPEAIVTGAATRGDTFAGTYEESGGCMLSKRSWQYEIRRTTERGREIVAAGPRDSRPSASVALQIVAQAILPPDTCCARRDDARRARGPFFLPEGHRAPMKLPPGVAAPLSHKRPPLAPGRPNSGALGHPAMLTPHQGGDRRWPQSRAEGAVVGAAEGAAATAALAHARGHAAASAVPLHAEGDGGSRFDAANRSRSLPGRPPD